MAQYADIEALVLSGELFNGPSRSSSPARSLSPDNEDHGWHDDELELSTEEQKRRDQGYDSDPDAEKRRLALQKEAHGESIGMGPGRTGVKGVIRDRDEAAEMQRDKKAREMEEARKQFEASNLGGKTYLEEEREKAARGEKADILVTQQKPDRHDVFGKKREGRFGHLREVGLEGFVDAVEKEDRGVWVVVHLYDPSLERCYLLDDTLAKLARTYPDTKIIRARASALGFASTKNRSRSTRRLKPPLEEDEDDPYADVDSDYGGYRDGDDDNVDVDVLPTMLVYRDGELVYNWVRVDWEAGRAGIEELLDKHNILPRRAVPERGNLGLPESDEEDDFDLIWSDDDDDKIEQ